MLFLGCAHGDDFWDWWRHDAGQDGDVRALYKKLRRDVLPELQDGTPDPRNLEIKNITTPLFSYTDPVNTYLVCHKVMVHRGELAPSISPGDCTVFLRGDGVVDGWTKVYHMSFLIADVKRPRAPDNCFDFLWR